MLGFVNTQMHFRGWLDVAEEWRMENGEWRMQCTDAPRFRLSSIPWHHTWSGFTDGHNATASENI